MVEEAFSDGDITDAAVEVFEAFMVWFEGGCVEVVAFALEFGFGVGVACGVMTCES